MKPSAAAVLRLLRSRGPDGVTPAEARRAVGCDRLAARVLELREAGYPIRSELIRVEGSRFARYVLKETPLPVPDRGVQTGIGW